MLKLRQKKGETNSWINKKIYTNKIEINQFYQQFLFKWCFFFVKNYRILNYFPIRIVIQSANTIWRAFTLSTRHSTWNILLSAYFIFRSNIQLAFIEIIMRYVRMHNSLTRHRNQRAVLSFVTPSPLQNSPKRILNALNDQCIQRILSFLIGDVRDFPSAAEVCRKFLRKCRNMLSISICIRRHKWLFWFFVTSTLCERVYNHLWSPDKIDPE